MLSKVTNVHIDSTYRLNMYSFPIIIVAFSDFNLKFFVLQFVFDINWEFNTTTLKIYKTFHFFKNFLYKGCTKSKTFAGMNTTTHQSFIIIGWIVQEHIEYGQIDIYIYIYRLEEMNIHRMWFQHCILQNKQSNNLSCWRC